MIQSGTKNHSVVHYITLILDICTGDPYEQKNLVTPLGRSHRRNIVPTCNQSAVLSTMNQPEEGEHRDI